MVILINLRLLSPLTDSPSKRMLLVAAGMERGGGMGWVEYKRRGGS